MDRNRGETALPTHEEEALHPLRYSENLYILAKIYVVFLMCLTMDSEYNCV